MRVYTALLGNDDVTTASLPTAFTVVAGSGSGKDIQAGFRALPRDA